MFCYYILFNPLLVFISYSSISFFHDTLEVPNNQGVEKYWNVLKMYSRVLKVRNQQETALETRVRNWEQCGKVINKEDVAKILGYTHVS